MQILLLFDAHIFYCYLEEDSFPLFSGCYCWYVRKLLDLYVYFMFLLGTVKA